MSSIYVTISVSRASWRARRGTVRVCVRVYVHAYWACAHTNTHIHTYTQYGHLDISCSSSSPRVLLLSSVCDERPQDLSPPSVSERGKETKLKGEKKKEERCTSATRGKQVSRLGLACFCACVCVRLLEIIHFFSRFTKIGVFCLLVSLFIT